MVPLQWLGSAMAAAPSAEKRPLASKPAAAGGAHFGDETDLCGCCTKPFFCKRSAPPLTCSAGARSRCARRSVRVRVPVLRVERELVEARRAAQHVHVLLPGQSRQKPLPGHGEVRRAVAARGKPPRADRDR